MRVITLMYHDVVSAADFSASGFSGAGADIYKLSRETFREHLDAVGKAVSHAPATVRDAREGVGSAVLLTFDDGGSGAWDHAAPLLEERGWRGHFFIPTNWIGAPGFLTADQIRLLHQRGHIIGSHSCSHPARMTSLPRDAVLKEWTESIQLLSDIVGEPITTASLPSGYYSRTVAETAADAGVHALFHSEPIAEVGRIADCRVFGRYSIQRSTPAGIAASIAAGAFFPRAQQYLFWEFKKILKRGGGDVWLKFRQYRLEQKNKALPAK